MGPSGTRPLILDAGALIGFERRVVRVRALLETALRETRRVVIPAGVVAQVWRDGARQARLAALVGDPRVDVRPLDLEGAKAVGALCGRAGASDVVDGHVALLGREEDGVVLTSDSKDLTRLDRSLRVVPI